MSRILVLGGQGMLGHKLVRTLERRHSVAMTLRESAREYMAPPSSARVIDNIDLRAPPTLADLMAQERWDVVINAAGLIKHRMEQDQVADAIILNAWLPRELARLCSAAGIRLIHFSTDCVFSGQRDSQRGPMGYRVEDLPDVRDLYGLSKLLGEPELPGCLSLRTSLVGREIKGHYGLVEWYLRQDRDEVQGFTQALFNGLSTGAAAELVDFLIGEYPELDGLWHVGSAPISKFDFLSLLRDRRPLAPAPIPSEEPYCDRRLDASAFCERTGWQAPDWPSMVDEMLGEASG